MADPENNTESRNSNDQRIELGGFKAMVPLIIETAQDDRYYHLSLTNPDNGIGIVRASLPTGGPDFMARDSIFKLGSRPWRDAPIPRTTTVEPVWNESPDATIAWGSLTRGEELVMELLEARGDEILTLVYTGHQVSNVVEVQPESSL